MLVGSQAGRQAGMDDWLAFWIGGLSCERIVVLTAVAVLPCTVVCDFMNDWLLSSLSSEVLKSSEFSDVELWLSEFNVSSLLSRNSSHKKVVSQGCVPYHWIELFG